MKTYDTYIFDLDGTITDTLTVWLGIFRDGLIAGGVTPPDDKTLSQHTHDWKQMLELGLPADKLDDFIALAHKNAKERLPEAPLHAGAFEALQALRSHGKRIAIFSTMDRPIFEPAMQYRGLDKLAEAAVAGTDVPNRKPAPDGILEALKQLGIAEEDFGSVVYIGDKDTDIQAAHNAGVDGVLYYPAAHQLFYNLNELQAHKPEAIITDWQNLTDSLR
jgi:phosphoglycolate phosphatase